MGGQAGLNLCFRDRYGSGRGAGPQDPWRFDHLGRFEHFDQMDRVRRLDLHQPFGLGRGAGGQAEGKNTYKAETQGGRGGLGSLREGHCLVLILVIPVRFDLWSCLVLSLRTFLRARFFLGRTSMLSPIDAPRPPPALCDRPRLTCDEGGNN